MQSHSDADALSRRRFLQSASAGVLATGLLGESDTRAMAQDQKPTPVEAPTTPAIKPIVLPPLSAPTDPQLGPIAISFPPDKRLGLAVVGLGHLALGQIIPAIGQTSLCKLTAVVSGSPDKANQVATQHGIPARSVYSYANYDSIRNNPDVDIIYIVLPNALHAEYTVRGAQAGKHILCEKPMATSVAECETMIQACAKANRKLMIAYRIQYEPNNRMIRQLIDTQEYGKVKLIESVNGQAQGDPNQWRQKKALAGGGCLPDVGLYCLNTTRFLTGEEPIEVMASLYSTPDDPRFREVEESVTWQMRFPSGILSNNATSYGFHECRRYRVYTESGWFGMDPAYSYDGLRMELDYSKGSVDHRESPRISPKNQFALEMDHMAECVLQNKTPYTPGAEGMQDHRIMAAIYESARTGKPVKLPSGDRRDAFRGSPPADS